MSAPVSAVAPALDDAEVAGDAGRGAGVVAGDHDDPHAGRVRLGDRRPRLRAGRVDDADHAEVDELALDRLVARAVARYRAAAGRRPPSVRSARSASRSTVASISPRRSSVSGRDLAGDPLVRAAGEQHVGRALGDDARSGPRRSTSASSVRHQLALRGERDLADPLEPRARAPR